MKWINQFRAMQHILNTGQGVVMEGCANADYCHFNAAYQAGWIQDEMKSLYGILTKNTLFHVFKPNLIVYLDAPVDVVRKKNTENKFVCFLIIYYNTVSEAYAL